MVLNRAVFGNSDEFLRRELCHERHDADVGAGFLHRTRGFRIAKGLQLMDPQTLLLRGDAQGIRPGAFLLGSAENRDGLVAARQKRFQHGFAEILLPDDCDLHRTPTSLVLGGVEKAPACFFAAMSASLQPSTSFRISSVCSPKRGDRWIFAGDAESLIGMPTLNHLPRWG